MGNYLNDRRYLCGTFDGPALMRGRVHIACNQPLLGKAITIVKNAIDSLVLCEVFAVGTPAQEREES